MVYNKISQKSKAPRSPINRKGVLLNSRKKSPVLTSQKPIFSKGVRQNQPSSFVLIRGRAPRRDFMSDVIGGAAGGLIPGFNTLQAGTNQILDLGLNNEELKTSLKNGFIALGFGLLGLILIILSVKKVMK